MVPMRSMRSMGWSAMAGLALALSVGCGGSGSTLPDAPVLPDAGGTGGPDAPPGTPDAAAGPDGSSGTPDGFVGLPDGSGAVPDATIGLPDAIITPQPDAVIIVVQDAVTALDAIATAQ
jgi:hypothetical protein